MSLSGGPPSNSRPERFDLARLGRERKHQDSWARARTLPGFPDVRHAWVMQGWPDKLTPGMVAILQAPADELQQRAIWTALLQECSQKTIACFAPDELRIHAGQFYTTNLLSPMASATPVPSDMLPHIYRLPYAAVADWLNDTGRVPSDHMFRWFDACGMERYRQSTPEGTEPGGLVGRVHRSKGKRGDLLTPLIDQAIQLHDTYDANIIWPTLVDFATAQDGPFVGLASGGRLKHKLSSGIDGFLDIKKLRQRLARLENPAKAR